MNFPVHAANYRVTTAHSSLDTWAARRHTYTNGSACLKIALATCMQY